MARGFSLELRCGTCHSSPIFPAGRRAHEQLLGELYISPNRRWMTWTGHYRFGRDHERNLLPGPRQANAAGPGTTWRPVPRDGIRHVCRVGGHTMALSEAELWSLVRSLPSTSAVLYLPAAEVPAPTPPQFGQIQTSTPSTLGSTARSAGRRAATGM